MDALIVAGSPGAQNAIAEVVRYFGKFDVVTAASGNAAKRAASERPFDLVIVNAGLSDEYGRETAAVLSERYEGGVIFIEQASQFDETTAQLEDYGIIVISKPLSKSTLLNAVKMVYATNMRLAGLRHENRDLAKKLEEMRLINRAKLVLIQTLGYSERQAHKYIEKKAMDMRLSRVNVAADILKTYEE